MTKLFKLFIIGISVICHNVESQDTREYTESNKYVTSQVLGIINELKDKIAYLEVNVSDLKLKNAEQASEIKELRRKTDEPNIAFTAVAYEARYFTYNTGDVVQFERVHTNIGGHYNATSGMFHCPVDGIFGFFTNRRTRNNRNIFIQIMHEGRELTGTASNGETGEQGSTMAIAECFIGQRVWIQASYHTNIIHSHPLGFTSFSGFLIRKN